MTRQTLLGVVAVALVCYWLGSCDAVGDRDSTVMEATAYRLARSLPAKRAQHVAELLAADSARTAVGRAEEGVSVVDQRVEVQRDSVMSVIDRLTMVNAEDKRHLVAYVALTDTLRLRHSAYRDSVNFAFQAQLRERYAAQALILQQDSTIRAFRDLADSRKCEALGLTCPSRKTSFLLGGAVGVVAVLLLL